MPHVKKFWSWFGLSTTFGCLYFVAFKCLHYINLDNLSFLVKPSVLFFLFFLVLCYALGSLLLAQAWRYLLHAESYQLSLRDSLSIYGRSQLVRYLPANFYNFSGRQTLGKLYGLTSSVLMRATIWEVGLQVTAGAIVGILCLVASIHNLLSVLLMIAIMLIVYVIIQILSGYISYYRIKSIRYCILFQLLAGCVFFMILHTSGAILGQQFHVLGIFGAYALSWLAGFVIPGAPGGIGVMEAVLYLILSPWFPTQPLLIGIILNRIVTTFGEVIFFTISHGVQRNLMLGSESV